MDPNSLASKYGHFPMDFRKIIPFRSCLAASGYFRSGSCRKSCAKASPALHKVRASTVATWRTEQEICFFRENICFFHGKSTNNGVFFHMFLSQKREYHGNRIMMNYEWNLHGDVMRCSCLGNPRTGWRCQVSL